MKKIEKERRKNEYNIQSVNKHLINILEENYYIELGNVDIKVLEKLFSGHPIPLSEIYYFPITVNGIGQISEDQDNDINYQINYLYSLHQKSSSSKFIITCGTVKYVDKEGVEKFAPIVLIPISMDYVKQEFIIYDQPMLNTMFLRLCRENKLLDEKAITELNALAANKIESVYDLDTTCIKLRDITGFSIGITNYLTLMEVEYSDYIEQENFFAVQRSIYEVQDIDLIKQYFKTVHAVKSANVVQKYIILKAHNGENFVVDGKLGAGKTSTAINIIADKIFDGKKVLYVNQDLDNITDLRKYIKYLGLDAYEYDLTKNIWNLDDIEPLDVMPSKDFNFDVIDDIASYRNLYHRKFHGYPYSYILEKIATRKSMGLEDKIFLEKNLDREEVEFVYESLKEIEKCLKNVDPLPDNIWARLQSGKNSLTVREIKENTIAFFEENKKLIRTLDRFTSKYHLSKVENITSFFHLIEEINSFRVYKPLKIWGSTDFTELCNEALSRISKYVDYYDNAEIYYDEHCTKEYIAGSIEKDFKVITKNRYTIKDHKSADVKSVDALLSNTDLLESLLEKAIKWVESSIGIYDKIKKYFDFESPNAEQFVLLDKLLTLFETNEIDESWLDEFILNPKILRSKAQKLNNISAQVIELYQKLQPFFNFDELPYETLKELVLDKRYVKQIKKMVQRQLLRKHKTNASVVATNLKLYYEKLTELKDELPNDTVFNKNDERTWNHYLVFLNFIDQLTPWETIVLTMFIKKAKANPKFSRIELLKDLTILRLNQNEFDILEKGLGTFNLAVTGSNFIECVNSIKSYIPYLEKAILSINNIKSYFINNSEINTFDVLELIEIDKQYIESKKHFESNDAKYKELYGDAYCAQKTNTILLGQTVEHFRNFIGRLKVYEGISSESIYTALLNENVFGEFLNATEKFFDLYENWYDTLRGFSICFYQGKMALQNATFHELNNILSTYVEKIDQLEPIYIVEHHLDSFHYYGLKDFANNIQDGKLNNDIDILSELYLYSTMNKYYKDMMKEGYQQFSISKLVKTVENFAEEENKFCETNIYELRKRASSFSDKKNSTFRMTPFVDPFNTIEKTVPNYKKLFITNIDIFNRIKDFSFFDLVIIDDAHLSTSNKYSNIYKASQVVIFGDASFQSSATNSLMQRNKNFSCIPLLKRYLEMKSEFGNIWQTDNQYIYTPSLIIEKQQLSGVEELADKVVEKFKEYYGKTDRKTINVLVTKSQTRREIYSYLVEKLSKEFSVEEVLRILNISIRIISTNYEATRLSDYTFLWYEDLESLNNLEMELVKRNYITAKYAVYLCYQGLRITKQNIQLMERIDDFIGQPMRLNFRIDGITKIIYNRLIDHGIDIEVGPGYIDLVVKKAKKNIGFIIYGQRTDMSYSIVDDYIYYVDEYRKRGWDIHIYCMEQLNNNLDDAIAEMVKYAKEGNK